MRGWMCVVGGWLALSLVFALVLGWLSRGRLDAPMPSRTVEEDDLDAKAS